ncbi:MAG: class I tRNA ligase family protein [Patescibacteria group bacterium]
MKKFYITTTLPYVNAPPHVGFALEIIQADVIARYHSNLGEEVFFNTGTDEHGLKVYKKALEEKRDPQEYCDEYAAKFDLLKEKLNLSYNNFIRTTDEHHIKAAQEFWKRCERNGDIYKKNYKTKYCVGCELEKTESELINGKCSFHPDREIEIIEEKNYFFRFSKYQKPLLDFYDANLNFVIPQFRQKEIYNFVKSGLQDFSISRLKSKMPWGVPVPGDDDQVMYVWFDALINYISCLGWPENQKKFEEFWGTKKNPNAIQVAGKDNLRQQTAMWQAMLMSAGLPNSKQVFIHGFINLAGQKVSKSSEISLPSPIELVDKYGIDATRYYLLREIPAYEDGDFSIKRFEERYNSDLANGLGNLVARVLTLTNKNKVKSNKPEKKNVKIVGEIKEKRNKFIEEFRFNEALEEIWRFISFCDKYINDNKPWELTKLDKKKLEQVLSNLLYCLSEITDLIAPFLPRTSEKIKEQIKAGKTEILFPRI